MSTKYLCCYTLSEIQKQKLLGIAIPIQCSLALFTFRPVMTACGGRRMNAENGKFPPLPNGQGFIVG